MLNKACEVITPTPTLDLYPQILESHRLTLNYHPKHLDPRSSPIPP